LGSSLADAPNPCNGLACNSNATCSVGTCCSQKCILYSDIPYVAGGATCDDFHLCQAPFACLNGLCLINSIGCPCTPNAVYAGDCTPNNGGSPYCESNQCGADFFTGDACTTNADCYPTPGVSCVSNVCQGSAAKGDICVADTDCGLDLFCKAGLCSAKYILSSGTTCIFSQECIGPLFLGGALCTNGKCVPASSVSNGGTCDEDFQCKSGSACNSGVCTAMGGQPCTSFTDCGSESDCIGCTSGAPSCSSTTPSVGTDCNLILSDWQSAILNLAPSDSQQSVDFILTYQPFINLFCCLDCSTYLGFLSFTGFQGSSASLLSNLNNFNLACDPGSQAITFVGNDGKCCNATSAGNCARTDTTGCAAFLASGVTLGLSKNEAIGIGVGVGVGGLLIIVGLITLCYCCCCKKKQNDN